MFIIFKISIIFVLYVTFSSRHCLFKEQIKCPTIYPIPKVFPFKFLLVKLSLHNRWSFSLRISSVNEIWSHLLKKSLMENFIFCAVFRLVVSYVFRMFAQISHWNIFEIFWEWSRFWFSVSHRLLIKVSKVLKFPITNVYRNWKQKFKFPFAI